jgi:uncharacterized protein
MNSPMPDLVRIFFGLVFFGLLFSIHLYLYRRLARDTTERRGWRVLGALLIGVPTLTLVSLRLLMGRAGVGQSIAVGSGLWVGAMLYTGLALVSLEVLAVMRQRWARRKPMAQNPAPEPKASPDAPAPSLDSAERRVFLARAAAVGSLALGGGLAGFGAWRAFTPAQITEVPIRLRGLPKSLEGFVLTQLTDIHVGAIIQERFLDDLVARANSTRPDLVAITGDLVDGSPSQLGRYVARLRNLSSRYGTHFVTGNHDYYSGADAWVSAVQGMGIIALRNRFVSIGEGADSFDLVGVDDYGTRMGPSDYDLDAALTGRDPQRASVLMAHQPSGFDAVAQRGLGLQISGHTHGGQIFPGTAVAELMWGARNTGLSKTQDSLLYVSRGCGFVGPPMRVGAPPEVVKFVLLPA